MLTCPSHPSYPGHCRRRNRMSNGLGTGKETKYLDPEVDRLILLSENYTTPVHQTVALFVKCKFRWDAPAISHRKHDPLASYAGREWGSLAVEALRNVATLEGMFINR